MIVFCFVVFVFVIVITYVILHNDHFWTRHPTFLHYTDLSDYWMNNYQSKVDSDLFLGKPICSFEDFEEDFNDWVDDSLDFFEFEFGISESSISLSSTKLMICDVDASISFHPVSVFPMMIQKEKQRRLGPFITNYICGLEIGKCIHVQSRKQLLQLYLGLTHSPFLFLSSPTEVPNVVPLVSILRRSWTNHENKDSSSSSVMSRRSQRKGPVKSLVYKQQLFATCFQLFDNVTTSMDIADQFEVVNLHFQSKEYMQFIFQNIISDSTISFLLLKEKEDVDCTFLFGVRCIPENALVATMTVMMRKGIGIQVLSFIVDEERARLNSSWREEGWMMALKCSLAVLLLQQIDKFADEELQTLVQTTWIADNYSEGLRFFQQFAPMLLNMAFASNTMPPVMFIPSLQEELALFSNNMYLPLENVNIHTNFAL